jgi:16S rRNA processing protein RimM
VLLIVGRIAKAHGVTGEVSVDVRTDDPQSRFADGAIVETDPAERGPLTVLCSRWHSGRLLVRFDGVTDRASAESLRGTLLVADSSTSAATGDGDEFWDHQLVGLTVVADTGEVLGTIDAVLHPPGAPLLAVRRSGGEELLVPFVRAFVPSVDVERGRVVVTPPDGLLDL